MKLSLRNSCCLNERLDWCRLRPVTSTLCTIQWFPLVRSPLALTVLPRLDGSISIGAVWSYFTGETYAHSAGTAQFLLQAIDESPRCAGLVGAEIVGDATETTESSPEGAEEDPAPVGLEVSVFLRGEDGKDVVVLVDGLAVVAAFLLVPPVAVRVAELALDGRGVDVAAVLYAASGLAVESDRDAAAVYSGRRKSRQAAPPAALLPNRPSPHLRGT